MEEKKISLEEVEYVARLSRLALTDEEKKLFVQQLDSILKYVEKLNELETSNVETTFHVLSLRNVFREDEVRDSIPLEDAIANAPDRIESFFRVPKIVE